MRKEEIVKDLHLLLLLSQNLHILLCKGFNIFDIYKEENNMFILNNIAIMAAYGVERCFYDLVKLIQIAYTNDFTVKVFDDDVLKAFKDLDEENKEFKKYE